MGYQHLEDLIMMCPVCVGPMKSYPYPDDNLQLVWLTQAVVLHLMDERNEGSEILENNASIEGGPCFSLEDGQWIAALDGPQLGNRDPSLYIPFHKVCLKIAKRTVDIKSRDEGNNFSFRHIWQTLKKQHRLLVEQNTRKCIFRPLTNLFNAKKYNQIEHYQQNDWDQRNEGAMEFLTDPFEIPEMTQSLVAQLHLCNVPKSTLELPDEDNDTNLKLFKTALSDLHTSGGISLECTRRISPSIWLQMLLETPIVPWLWDLNHEVLHSKEGAKPADKEWDWELLVRQLAQPDIHVPGAVLEGVPTGLRNRQRIWRLIEDLLMEEA